MAESRSNPTYVLGNSQAEQARLIRQAAALEPFTEQFFRDAGVTPGQSVLDLGSGAGDVSLLLARLVGPAGQVLGIERDGRSVEQARARISQAGLHNVTFTQTDVTEIGDDRTFDAAVGRYILMYLPDPAAVLRSLQKIVRPGGVVAFQDVSWAGFLRDSERLPLWRAAGSLIRDTFVRSGANTEMGPALSRIFQEAGLTAPSVRTDVLRGINGYGTDEWVVDIITSLRPQMQKFGFSLEPLGDLDTLLARMRAEVATAKTVAPSTSLVGAWSRKL
jgi:ubiquinone/menaquinone biosynthesis C-methylase UbiE